MLGGGRLKDVALHARRSSNLLAQLIRHETTRRERTLRFASRWSQHNHPQQAQQPVKMVSRLEVLGQRCEGLIFIIFDSSRAEEC